MRSISPATLCILRSAISDTPVARSTWCLNTKWRQNHSSNQSLFTQRKRVQSIERCEPAQAHRFISSAPPKSLEVIFETMPQTHYDFFPTAIPQGPPPSGSFTIDLSALKREFIQLQALAHPDRHPPERRNRAQGLSARINEAYRTLQSPLKRAEYLLELRGARNQGDEEHVLGKAEGDEEILMEVMEAREEAEETDDENEISRLRETNQNKIDGQVEKLVDSFKQDDLIRAKREAVRLSYWIGVEDRLRQGNSMH